MNSNAASPDNPAAHSAAHPDPTAAAQAARAPGTTPAWLAGALEVALNRTLRLEPSVLRDCERLTGRLLALELSDWNWVFIVEPMATGVRVLTDVAPAGQAPEVTVSASTPRLLGAALRLAMGDSLDQLARPGRGDSRIDPTTLPAGVSLSGNTELLQSFAGLLQRVGLDPEELLAQVLPQGAAHRVAQSLHSLFNFGRRAGQRLLEDTSDYLREETGDLASAKDVEEWMREVEALRAQVDRLDARIALAEQRNKTR